MGAREKQRCRFAIRSPSGRVSDRWVVWTSKSRTKSDLYLAPILISGRLKVSIHESGQCHVSFSNEFYNRIANLPEAPKSRHMMKWEPARLGEGIDIAIKLLIPTSELSDIGHSAEADDQVIWVPAAPVGKAVEFAFVFTKPNILVSGWPGRISMGTELLKEMPLPNGRTVWVVHTVVDIPQQELDELARMVSRRRTTLLSPRDGNSAHILNRTVFIAPQPDGTCALIEAGLRDVSKM